MLHIDNMTADITKCTDSRHNKGNSGTNKRDTTFS